MLQETSQRLNVAWQQLLAEVIEAGVAAGSFACADPDAAAWRILSLLDGLALQTVAHRVDVDRDGRASPGRRHPATLGPCWTSDQ